MLLTNHLSVLMERAESFGLAVAWLAVIPLGL